MPDDMLKFILAARRRREDTQERYFYEWGNIHVALMLMNPVVLTLFKRYTQHYSIAGILSDALPLPLSRMEWDNMADHWLASYDDLLQALIHPEYVTRMQPHKFGDPNFHVMLMSGEPVHVRPDFASGGVKLLLWGAGRPGETVEHAAAAWRERVHGKLLRSAAGARIRKYVHNVPRPVDPAMFAGTLFARGDVNEFALLDEIWLDSVDALPALRDEGAFRDGAAVLDRDRSFAMAVTERVVCDFVSEGERTKPPAVLTPGSLETRVAAQGGAGWNLPK